MPLKSIVILLAAACSSIPQGLAAEQPSTVRGRICDVFMDDVDEAYVYAKLEQDGKSIYVSTRCSDTQQEFEHLLSMIGCDVSMSGTNMHFNYRSHRLMLQNIFTRHSGEKIIVHHPPPRDAFAVPDICEAPPELHQIDSCGPRKVRGHVIARWGGDKILLQTTNDAIKVQLRHLPLPDLGTAIEAVGKVSTDLYRFNLQRAIWRKTGHPSITPCPPDEHSIPNLFSFQGRRTINSGEHGRAISVTGMLKSILSDEHGRNRFIIEKNKYQMIVDCSALPGTVDKLQEGSSIKVSGVCILESENWRPDMIFPKISGLFLVPRTTNEIIVLQLPSWWTPARCLAVVLGLLFVLVLILIWNMTLHALVARKSHALLREQAEKLSETLKIDERTRLAAELHDYLAQNLTVISYQVSAAESALAAHDEDAASCLKTADRMLLSCRTDLRRCLWDLKSDVLNESNFAKAIELTAEPVSGDAQLLVHFTANRQRLSDSTAHAILSICRELVANAVRHGRADKVQIVGEQKIDTIRFSIEDNGCGFNPSKRPGQTDGHFGLDGVAERIERLNGKLQIDSLPGQGTRIAVTLRPKDTQT